jgi:hypothetical protein
MLELILTAWEAANIPRRNFWSQRANSALLNTSGDHNMIQKWLTMGP